MDLQQKFCSLRSKRKGRGPGGKGDKKIRGKKEEGGLGTGEERREGSACSHAIVFFIYTFAGERKNPIG